MKGKKLGAEVQPNKCIVGLGKYSAEQLDAPESVVCNGSAPF